MLKLRRVIDNNDLANHLQYFGCQPGLDGEPFKVQVRKLVDNWVLVSSL